MHRDPETCGPRRSDHCQVAVPGAFGHLKWGPCGIGSRTTLLGKETEGASCRAHAQSPHP